MTSIAAVSSVSSKAHASAVLNAPADDDFDSVLASNTPQHESEPAVVRHIGAPPVAAPIAAPKITSAPIAKTPQHTQRLRLAAKREVSGAVAAQGDAAPVHQAQPSKVEAPMQPATMPVPVVASVPAAAALGNTENPTNENSAPAQAFAALQGNGLLDQGSLNQARTIGAPLNILVLKTALLSNASLNNVTPNSVAQNNASQNNAAPNNVAPNNVAQNNAPLNNTPLNNAPLSNVALNNVPLTKAPLNSGSLNLGTAPNALSREMQAKSALFEAAAAPDDGPSQQTAPMKATAVPSKVVEEIIAIAGNQPKQMMAPPQTANNPASPQNIANLTVAARASVVVTPLPESEPATAAKPRIAKPDLKTDAKVTAPPSGSIGKAAPAPVLTGKQSVVTQQQDAPDDSAQLTRVDGSTVRSPADSAQPSHAEAKVNGNPDSSAQPSYADGKLKEILDDVAQPSHVDSKVSGKPDSSTEPSYADGKLKEILDDVAQTSHADSKVSGKPDSSTEPSHADGKFKGIPDDVAQPSDIVGKADGHNAQGDTQLARHDQPVAAPDKPAQCAAAPSTQIQQPVVPAVNQIVAGTPAANAGSRVPTPQAPAPEAQPNIGAIAIAIAAKSAAGSKIFEIRLDPPELGHVDVHLTIDNDGRVQALVTADRPHTLDLLQRGSHDLERALKDTGLNLSNNSLNFSLKGEGRQGDGGGASMARTRSLTSAVVARAEAVNASEINLSSASGRLDIRV